MNLLPYAPFALVFVGFIVGAALGGKLRDGMRGAFTGFLVSFLPYLVFRASGTFHPYFSQGYVTIEAESESRLIGWVWWSTYFYGQLDSAICIRIMEPPAGG